MFFCSPLYFPMHRVFSQAEASSQNMVNTDQKGAMKQGAMRQGREASMNTQGIWGSWGRDTEASMWGQVRAPNMHFLARDSLHHGVCEYSKIIYKSRNHICLVAGLPPLPWLDQVFPSYWKHWQAILVNSPSFKRKMKKRGRANTSSPCPYTGSWGGKAPGARMRPQFPYPNS